MTTIDESLTAKGYTPNAQVTAAFGQPRNIEGIVIHHWGLPGQTHDGVVNFFVNGPGATSAHYVVSAGRIHCLVSDSDAAWHCPGKNATTIGIECRPEATDGDYATVAELIRTLRARYGNLPLSRHRDWFPTACPGVWDLDRLDKLARAGGSIQTQSVPQEDTLSAADVKELKDHINALVYGGATWKGEKRYPLYAVGAETQKRVSVGIAELRAQVAALSNVVTQLAKSPGSPVDMEAVKAAAADGAKQALSGMKLVSGEDA